jgi:hypothetical protein
MGRPCDRCGREFNRSTKYVKICETCSNISFAVRDAKVHKKVLIGRIFLNLNKNATVAH